MDCGDWLNNQNQKEKTQEKKGKKGSHLIFSKNMNEISDAIIKKSKKEGDFNKFG